MAKICPKCGCQYAGKPALSRTDNKAEICPDCGMREALEAWREKILSKEIGENSGQRAI